MVQAVILILLIANMILQWIVVGLIVKALFGSRLEISWRATFWGQTRYGFDVLLWKHPRHARVAYNEGRTVFGFNWRNPKSIDDHPDINVSKWALPFVS